MQPPPQPPPLNSALPASDREHLKLLVLFHYIFAGLVVLGMLFLVAHYAVMNAIFANPDIWEEAEGAPPPQELFEVFRWIYLFGALVLIAACVMNILSAGFMRRRRHRIFSLVVAGLNCLSFPFGTALGVFTIIVLLRPTVKVTYGEA